MTGLTGGRPDVPGRRPTGTPETCEHDRVE